MSSISTVAEKIVAIYRKLYRNKKEIALHEPLFSGNELSYVTDCIKTGWVSTAGNYIPKFENEIKNFTGSPYCVSTNTGTAALHVAFLTLGANPETEIICPDISFAATAAAICHTGAHPVFLDVEESTLGLCPDAVLNFLKENADIKSGVCINKKTHRQILGMVVMHNIGLPVRLQELEKICREYHLHMIEDAAESLGSEYHGKKCGRFGALGIFSFNGNKIITTGGGGAIVTESEELYLKVRHLATTAKIPHPYRYIHTDVGYNYRLPNINAALGLAQMENLPKFLQVKERQFSFLKDELASIDEIEIKDCDTGKWNHWFMLAKVKKFDLDTLIQELAKHQLMARPVWSKISQMKPYEKFHAEKNLVAEEVLKKYMCLPNGVASLA